METQYICTLAREEQTAQCGGCKAGCVIQRHIHEPLRSGDWHCRAGDSREERPCSRGGSPCLLRTSVHFARIACTGAGACVESRREPFSDGRAWEQDSIL